MPTLAQWFTGANVFVLPFWTLMILLPNWDWTRRVMTSLVPFIALALLYTGLFVTALTPESAQALSNPTLPVIAQFFSDQRAAATGWVHYLVMDLFVGRWIYWEGQRLGIWTSHSLALCFFAGPMGLLSHIVTSAIAQKYFPTTVSSNPSPDPLNPDATAS
jgi:Domain of unknown function (DUF4281)